MSNPYSSPAESSEMPITAATQPQDSLDTIARRTFLAWEKLRLIYLAICGGVTLLLGMTGAIEGLGTWEYWQRVIAGGIFANVMYFAGPVMETYLTWLGSKSLWPRYILFAAGTLFTVVLAIGSLVDLIPSQM